jgi:superfamily II DNA or RNA helicase
MAWEYSFNPKINLFVEGKIQESDAKRQEKTAIEILNRLQHQPGLILADEVGMGKTFVALAVALSISLKNNKQKPVVVMIPPALKNKWPGDFNVFTQRCLGDIANKINCGVAETKLDFLKLLDDKGARRKHVIFLIHGALYREKLGDKWVKIAIIQRAIKGRKDADELRKALYKYLGKILNLSEEKKDSKIIQTLLNADTSQWKSILIKAKIFTESDDDPIPDILHNVMYNETRTQFFNELYQLLNKTVPRRNSKYFDQNIQDSRTVLTDSVAKIWKKLVESLSIRLPLLIFDEAHHLKNSQTQVSSLFKTPDSQEDANQVDKGFLSNIFERMLFLTATPFQLGHHELCNILDRFKGIAWKSSNSPEKGKDVYINQLTVLRNTLDQAQESAIRLDNSWGDLHPEDLQLNDVLYEDVETWWSNIKQSDPTVLGIKTATVLSRFEDVRVKLKKSETLLRPFIIRHIKPKFIHIDQDKRRRSIIPGKGIISSLNTDVISGLEIDSTALFPFLLAARLTACTPQNRPIFAEGLSSSYEAFRDTRRRKTEDLIDKDDQPEGAIQTIISPKQEQYLGEIDAFLTLNRENSGANHPKIAATVKKVKDLWLSGEKVLVFCHYIETGKALRKYISSAIKEEIVNMATKLLKCEPSAVWDELDRIGTHFEGEKMILKRVCEKELSDIISHYPNLTEHTELLMDIFKRYLKTPSFLVRFFPLDDSRLDENTFDKAMKTKDSSQMTLYKMINDFLSFLDVKCEPEERIRYLNALRQIQPGGIRTKDVSLTYAEDEIKDQDSDIQLGNVRLVNGSTKDLTRQRLMLTFNTPFYPDILIASSVMAEGVDLHLNCRHIIHHDLCWNPSTLEQRTGRIDRIGAKVETCGQPIEIYLPYIGETQDEKMYKVVMDRDRWFKVVMGEKYSVDAKTTEKMAERVPLPLGIAEELMFNLEV